MGLTLVYPPSFEKKSDPSKNLKTKVCQGFDFFEFKSIRVLVKGGVLSATWKISFFLPRASC